MSLNWSVSKVANHEVVTTSPFDENKWHPVTDALVWMSMSCGYNKITKENLVEVTRRVMTYQSAIGAYLSLAGDDVYVTPTDIAMHIGLSTNASSLTKAQFIKKLGEIVWERECPHFRQNKSAWDICADSAAKAKAEKQAA